MGLLRIPERDMLRVPFGKIWERAAQQYPSIPEDFE